MIWNQTKFRFVLKKILKWFETKQWNETKSTNFVHFITISTKVLFWICSNYFLKSCSISRSTFVAGVSDRRRTSGQNRNHGRRHNPRWRQRRCSHVCPTHVLLHDPGERAGWIVRRDRPRQRSRPPAQQRHPVFLRPWELGHGQLLHRPLQRNSVQPGWNWTGRTSQSTTWC